MPAKDPEERHILARMGGRKRLNPDADLDDLRAQLAAHRLAAHIERVKDEAPGLTTEQFAQLAALLAPGGGQRDAA
jgi:hypothetical protein